MLTTATDRDESLLEQDWFQRRIQSFSNVFQQNWVPDADRVLERA